MRPLVAACVLLAVGSTAQAQQGSVPLVDAVPSLTVEGVAKREAKPDLAVATLGVTTDRPTAADAVRENTGLAASIVTAARGAGVGEADIQTAQLRLLPVYDPHNAGKASTFRATNQVTLRFHDLEKVGTIVGQLVAHGANDIQSIDFEIADPEPVLDDLRAEATRNARAKAEIYAKAAGVTLGRVLRIGPTGSPTAQFPIRTYRVAAAPSPAPPVEAGAETMETRVDVTWELLPAVSANP